MHATRVHENVLTLRESTPTCDKQLSCLTKPTGLTFR